MMQQKYKWVRPVQVLRKSITVQAVALADGNLLGISMGGPLVKDMARTAIARKALALPVQITAAFEPVIGAQVNLSDTTGKAIASGAGATAVNASYASEVLTGVMEDGTEVDVVLIDFPGGL